MKPKGPTQAELNKEKLKEKRENQQLKKEDNLNKLTDEEVTQDLKNKGLPTFGTKNEKLLRLKKYYGVQVASGMIPPQQPVQPTQIPSNPVKPGSGHPKSDVVLNIEKMTKAREERREKNEEKRRKKNEKEEENLAAGKKGDVEFEMLIENARFKEQMLEAHTSAKDLRLCVCVRKRPLFKKESSSGENDSVSVANPQIKVHECKFKVDGITKYVENHTFTFDNTFNENESTEDLYECSIEHLIPLLLNQGIITCFAYGQTSSGKTFTMKGIQNQAVEDIYQLIKKVPGSVVASSFFEIYGGRAYDLLNNHNLLNILEDKNHNIQITGLVEKEASTPAELNEMIEYGNSTRTTHATIANDTSSRSHAICTVIIKDSKGGVLGKLILVDLAGSERAQDTQSNNRQRRLEGAEINKSLLGLKECIRAMDDSKGYIPFRASKLTLVLRDSFISKSSSSKIVMIACVCPSSSSADHTINTLRYANRLKEKQNKTYDQPNSPEEVVPIPPPKPVEQPKKIVVSHQEERKNDQQIIKKPPPAKPSSVKNLAPQGVINKKASGAKGFDNNSHDSDDEEEEAENLRAANADIDFLKKTLISENKNQNVDEGIFNFHQTVNQVLEEQENLFQNHITAIKEDAMLLSQESELVSNVQGIGFADYDIDTYVAKMEEIVKKKLKLYTNLDKKLKRFKAALKEEEEQHSKVKDTFYYQL